MAVTSPSPSPPRALSTAWIFPVLLLCTAYGLLGLTFVQHSSHLMERCVLMDPNRARIWSVGHVEIGLAYLGIFGAMVYYFLGMYGKDRAHLTDLGLAVSYILASFTLDLVCVTYFIPFVALLIGDAIVITFTVIVSRQLWFQRLLGVFVPLVFLTCGIGHFLEGLSYWQLTYPINVPWTMVTADIGFAILVNAVRFPAFIRGQDVVEELAQAKQEAQTRQTFFRDVLMSATEGHLHLCHDATELPRPLPSYGHAIVLTRETLRMARQTAADAARAHGFSEDRVDNLLTAVGEAAMNAIVHGGGGTVTVSITEEAIQVWVQDQGAGIQITQLPRAALERGFSTKDSLGHGFWMMLQTSDRLDLLSGREGTTLVITLYREAAPAYGFFPTRQPSA